MLAFPSLWSWDEARGCRCLGRIIPKSLTLDLLPFSRGQGGKLQGKSVLVDRNNIKSRTAQNGNSSLHTHTGINAGLRAGVCVGACVNRRCVCVPARESACSRACVFACHQHVSVSACVCARTHAQASVYVCLCVRLRMCACACVHACTCNLLLKLMTALYEVTW